ncbi:MAG: hypothetical protein P8Y53_16730 [Pseudolabrys sp.]
MDAADIGDQHVRVERGQVDDVVDAGAERLDPFQLGGVAHHVVRHGRREAQQDVGVGDVGLDLAVVADRMDGQFGEQLLEPRLVAGGHRFLDFGEDEDVRHGGRGVLPTVWEMISRQGVAM